MQEDWIWEDDSFGEVIRRARETQGLTQKALAARGGISGMYVSQIESQQRIPALPTCRRLAQALRLDEQRLLRLAVPAEVHELLALTAPTAAPVAQLPKPWRRLFDKVQQLTPAQQQELLKMWESVLKLLPASTPAAAPEQAARRSARRPQRVNRVG